MNISSYLANQRNKGQLSSLIVTSMMLLSCSISGLAGELPPLDCVITPSIMVDVSSPVPGTLAEVSVDRSDVVKKGQIIARLNSKVEQATVDLARAKAELDSEINIGRVNLIFDEEKSNRLDELYGVAMASSQDRDDAKRNLALSKEKLRHAEELRKLRQLELRKAEAQLNQKIIRSPIQGVVVQRFKTVSEHIEDEAIVRIAQVHPLYVEAIVPIEFFGQISTNMEANVFSDTFLSSPQRALVTIVDQMGDAASGTFGVRLELPNPEYKLPAGIKCNVQILPDMPRQQTDNVKTFEHESIINRNLSADSAPVVTSVIGKIGHNSVAGSSLTPTKQMCSSLGPYGAASDARQLLGALEDKKFSYSLREESPKNVFIILAPEQENLDQSWQLVARLKEAGIEDVAIVLKGRYKGRISLGMYHKKRFYRRRISHIAKLGFETETHEMVKNSGKWWVDIVQPISDTGGSDGATLHESLAGMMEGKEVRPLSCPKS